MNLMRCCSLAVVVFALLLAPAGPLAAGDRASPIELAASGNGDDYAAAWSEVYGQCAEACPTPSVGSDRQSFGASLKQHAACTKECRREACRVFEQTFERVHQTTTHIGGCK